jgi:hypothetical protein
MHPAARRREVIVQELDQETMVYDIERQECHLLNPLAAIVFRHADGETPLGGLAVRAAERLGADVGPTQIEVALDELARVHLLDSPETESAARPSLTRRAAAKRLATLVLATPLVTSLIAPTPAMAASGHHRRSRGTNGAGNGVDAAPPGNGNAGNYGPGTNPGNPVGSQTAPGLNGGNPTGNGGGNDKEKVEEKDKDAAPKVGKKK